MSAMKVHTQVHLCVAQTHIASTTKAHTNANATLDSIATETLARVSFLNSDV